MVYLIYCLISFSCVIEVEVIGINLCWFKIWKYYVGWFGKVVILSEGDRFWFSNLGF